MTGSRKLVHHIYHPRFMSGSRGICSLLLVDSRTRTAQSSVQPNPIMNPSIFIVTRKEFVNFFLKTVLLPRTTYTCTTVVRRSTYTCIQIRCMLRSESYNTVFYYSLPNSNKKLRVQRMHSMDAGI